MRRLMMWALTGVLPALALAVFSVGCGGTSKPGDTGGGEEEQKAEPLKPVESKGRATIKGKAVLDGTYDPTSANKKIQDQMANHKNKDLCLAGKEWEKEQQAWRVGPMKELANVVVYVQPPKGHYFKIEKDEIDAAKGDKFMDQPHCAFDPHVVVLFPSYNEDGKKQVRTGQKFTVKNTASEPHNTKWGGTYSNPGENPTIPAGGSKELTIKPEYKPIPVSCGIHEWMNATIWAFDHPYAAVTDEKGEFEIKNVPAGAKIKLFAWHEKANDVNEGGKSGQEIELKDGETKTVDFKVPAPK